MDVDPTCDLTTTTHQCSTQRKFFGSVRMRNKERSTKRVERGGSEAWLLRCVHEIRDVNPGIAGN